jgi:hypothetical protein
MQHSVERPTGARPTVIEIGGERLGVAIPSGKKFRFIAVKLPVFAIDGREFESIEAAHEAARAALALPLSTAV